MPTEAIRGFEIPRWARLGAIGLCYFAAAKASLLFAIPPGYATAIWPASGIALAALLLLGLRAWPGVWLGAALTNYTVDLSIPSAIGIAAGNTLEGVCAAWLAGRLTERHAEFVQPEKVFLFAAIAAVASVVAATFGVSSLYLAGAVSQEHFLANWYTWWQGDTTGILLVTPCILAWTRSSHEPGAGAGSVEYAAFGALLVGTLIAVFAHGAEGYDPAPLAFLVFPFFLWAACRFSERIVTLTVLGANGWAIWCTVNGLGPFQGFPLNEALLMLQAFTSTGTLAALVLWALLRRRADALEHLQVSRDELGQGMWSRTRGLREQVDALNQAQALAQVGSWRWDEKANRLLWSEELCRICGIAPEQFEGTFEAYFACVHPEDRERVRDAVKDAYANDSSWDSTERVVRPNGEVRVLRSIGRSVKRRKGAMPRMQGVCIDITDRANLSTVSPPEHNTTPLEELGLPEALRASGAQFELRTGISVEVVGNNTASNLEARAALALFRIAQEALKNVSDHAQARRVFVELAFDAGLATLTVRDDGRGFDPAWQEKGGSGLKRIRERAESVGGRLWIESSPGSGATLRVTARG